MGYESNVHVIDKRYGSYSIAKFDLCKMYHNEKGIWFQDAFTHPVSELGRDIYIEEPMAYAKGKKKLEMEGMDSLKEDLYGDELKYATVDELLEWLDSSLGGDYWREEFFKAALESMKKDNGGRDLIFVHYGH